jgi:hypothetical protein
MQLYGHLIALNRFYFDEVVDRLDESTGLRVVLANHRLPDLPETECP